MNASMKRVSAISALLALGSAACLGSVDRTYFDDEAPDGTTSGDAATTSPDAAAPDAAPPPPAKTYAIGGLVGDLAGTGLVLRNNGGDDLSVTASGPFAFATKAVSGAPYAVSVASQPTNPTQTCVIAGATGAVGQADVTNIVVACGTDRFKVGGTLTGLSGGSVVLQNNAGDNLAMSANGAFTFATSVLSGLPYAATVLSAPAQQDCTVTNGTGTIGSADVTNVAVACVAKRYTVGGTAIGIVNTGLQLQNSVSGETLAVPANGAFSFLTTVTSGGSYAVTVTQNPPGQSCVLTNGSGSNVTANAGNLQVVCRHVQNFDGTTAPALPTSWAAATDASPSNCGGGGCGAWTVTSGGSSTPPNHVFASYPQTYVDNQNASHKTLTSRAFFIQTTTATLRFTHSFDCEGSAAAYYDGGVLEIAIPGVAGGAFQDILTAGGTFVSNGYVGTLSSGFSNVLGGRQAWSGSSGGYITTDVNLPATAANTSIQLRWRFATDELIQVAGGGWRIDSVLVGP